MQPDGTDQTIYYCCCSLDDVECPYYSFDLQMSCEIMIDVASLALVNGSSAYCTTHNGLDV